MGTSIKSGSRAVADVAQGRILASVEIAAPIERVFEALTTSADLTSWWGSADTYETTKWVADVRVGGHWRADGVSADGSAFFVEGEFLEVDSPRKLVQTWKAAWDGGNETTITYRLETMEGGTRLTLNHEGFGERTQSCRQHGEGWKRVLDWLGDFLVPPSVLTYHLCRLVPPRPTFAQDLNAEERELMGKHSAYLKRFADEGTVLVYGPVADPQGPWGLAIARVSSAEELRALTEGDPTILSKRGFRYETMPMLRAITKY